MRAFFVLLVSVVLFSSACGDAVHADMSVVLDAGVADAVND